MDRFLKVVCGKNTFQNVGYTPKLFTKCAGPTKLLRDNTPVPTTSKAKWNTKENRHSDTSSCVRGDFSWESVLTIGTGCYMCPALLLEKN